MWLLSDGVLIAVLLCLNHEQLVRPTCGNLAVLHLFFSVVGLLFIY